MPNSYKDYDDATASTTSVTFNTGDFEYLDTAHLRVVVTNTANVSTDFLQTSTGQDNTNPPFTVTVSSPNTTINFNNMNGVTGSGLPANTDKVRVQRVTPASSLLTTFQNASLLRADDLNDNAKQLLFVLQEQVDAGTGSLPLNAAGVYDANLKRITNIADGTAEQDVASFGQVSAFAAFSTDAPTVPQFTTFAGAEGTFANGDTTFTIPFTPLSEIDATYICEVGGVVQVPGADFRVTGNILTIIGRDVTNSGENIAKIVLQSFGVTKSVFDFPITGEASVNTEVPLTLKGAESGDNAALMLFKTQDGVVNAAVTANGKLKARDIEPLSGQTLDVNPTNITTTGTITSGGNLTVGPASITQATGDATVNNLTITSSTQNANQAVPKSYVDANSGFNHIDIAAGTNLSTLLTPGLYTGAVPSNPGPLNYPGPATEGKLFCLRVVQTGGTTSTTRFQEFLNANDNRIYHRKYNGSIFGPWIQSAVTNEKLSAFEPPIANISMNNKKVINLADPTNNKDAVNKQYYQNQFTAQFIADAGPFVRNSVCTKTGITGLITASEKLLEFANFSSINGQGGIGLELIQITGNSASPPQVDGSGDDGLYLFKVPENFGPFNLTVTIRTNAYMSGSIESFKHQHTSRLYEYTTNTAAASGRTLRDSFVHNNDSTQTLTHKSYNRTTAVRYFGVSIQRTDGAATGTVTTCSVNINRSI